MADNEYLAKPSGECCMRGCLHEGEPRGRIVTIAGIKSYITRPSKPNGQIVFYFPDIWGFLTNAYLVMDGFAEAGFTVLGLDYSEGDPVWVHRKTDDDVTTEPGFNYEAWKIKHQAFASAHLSTWVDAAKQQYGKLDTKYACVWYCFGAPYVWDELARQSVTAGAFAHPAFLKEHHFLNVKGPLFMSCAEIDHSFGAESRRKATDILQSRRNPYQVQLFSGVVHGFALRGDPSIGYERYTQEQSLQGIAKWFQFWLSGAGNQ